MLGKIGMFSVGSVHAVVSVRELGRSANGEVTLHVGGNQNNAASAFSPVKSSPRSWVFRSKKNSKRPRRRVLDTSAISEPFPQLNLVHHSHSALSEPDPLATAFGTTIKVNMPNHKVCTVPFRSNMAVRDLLVKSCQRAGLDPDDHFVRIKREGGDGGFECDTPGNEELISALEFAELEVVQKFVHTVFLTQPTPERLDGMGLRLLPVWADSATLSHVTVESVSPGSPADQNGISEGDEIVLVNDVAAGQIQWPKFTALMQEPTVSLTLRSSQVEANVAMRSANLLLSDLIVQAQPPPPPCKEKSLSDKQLGALTVPRPSMEDLTRINSVENLAHEEPDPEFSRQSAIEQLLQESMEVNSLVIGIAEDGDGAAPALTPLQQVVRCSRELVETEQSHVKNLDHLVDRYLEPLQHESFLCAPEEVERVHANVASILSQQTSFLRKLEECIEEVDDSEQESVKRMLLGVSETFQSNMEMFRQYSFFCTAQHMWSVIVEVNQDSHQMQQFLDARNPNKDPKLSIESLIIKAILRVLRYPLFLQAMRELTEPDSEERAQLSEVIIMVDKVSGFINEVKRVTEMYASVFDALLQESGLAEFGVSIHISDLQYDCKCMWLNPASNHKELVRGWRKGEGPPTQCFAFPSAAVLICTDREHRKRGSKGAARSRLNAEDISYSVLLPLAQCKVNDLPDSDGVDNMWQIVHKSRRGGGPNKYLLRSSSVEEKGRMVHILRQSIQDQVSLYGGIRTSASLSLTHTTTFCGSLYSGRSSSPSLASQMTLLSRTDPSSQNLSSNEVTTAL